MNVRIWRSKHSLNAERRVVLFMTGSGEGRGRGGGGEGERRRRGGEGTWDYLGKITLNFFVSYF